MKALICPNEPVSNGYRIAQVEPDDKIFGVAEPLYWMNCDDNVVANQWYFDTTENIIKQVPVIILFTGNTTNNQPTTTGSQTL